MEDHTSKYKLPTFMLVCGAATASVPHQDSVLDADKGKKPLRCELVHPLVRVASQPILCQVPQRAGDLSELELLTIARPRGLAFAKMLLSQSESSRRRSQ